MGIFVKICGICSEGDLGQISALGPDAVGFIQWPQSRRYIEPKTVGRWDTPKHIKRVGVFVSPTEAELAHAAQYARLDVLQVHRIPDNWKLDREIFQGLEVWRALNPDDMYFMDHGFAFDRYLLDSYDPVTVGGTGKTCDWGKAQTLVHSVDVPMLLAGGLTPENVAEAIAVVKPWGVDVSSGVETEPGKKDIDKVAAFIAAARGINRKPAIDNQ
jgi:phosphoribosylanthranilate isomerase